MKFRPIGNLIAIREIELPDTTPGGLALPHGTRATVMTTTGEVMAVGPGTIAENGSRVPLTVKVGDTVVLPSNKWATISVEDLRIMVMPEDALLGIL